MAKSEKVLGKDQAVILGSSCLIAGFLLGLLAYHFIAGGPSPSPSPKMPMQAQAPMMQQQPQFAPPQSLTPPGPSMQQEQEIKALRAIVEKQPKNRETWVTLGNLLFDTNQPAEAVKAYSKALELNPKDPNVLTDRGIMYRALKDFQAAIADFRKAAEIDPNHAQCLFNLGIVYLHDLQDFPNAIKAWEDFLKRPVDPQAKAQVESQLATLRNMANK